MRHIIAVGIMVHIEHIARVEDYRSSPMAHRHRILRGTIERCKRKDGKEAKRPTIHGVREICCKNSKKK